MRITGGFLGNRRLEVPGSGVRPTQDRVRQALFSSLAARIPECRFLDLCAGSGGVGIEAWSRGAAAVWWVENHPRTYSLLKKNVETLCGPPSASGGALRIFRDEALRFLGGEAPGEPFDVIFADPPYGIKARNGVWVVEALAAAARNGFLKPETVFVMEQSAREPVSPAPGWRPPEARSYGETALVFYGREGQS